MEYEMVYDVWCMRSTKYRIGGRSSTAYCCKTCKSCCENYKYCYKHSKCCCINCFKSYSTGHAYMKVIIPDSLDDSSFRVTLILR